MDPLDSCCVRLCTAGQHRQYGRQTRSTHGDVTRTLPRRRREGAEVAQRDGHHGPVIRALPQPVAGVEPVRWISDAADGTLVRRRTMRGGR